jgi:hypothetical protein
MKLVVNRFVYEAPSLSVIPETDYEAAVLARYWETAKLSIGKSSGESANGSSYGIKFMEEEHA